MKKDANAKAGWVDWCEKNKPVAPRLIKWGLTLWFSALVAGCQISPAEFAGERQKTPVPPEGTPPEVIALREGDILKISFPGSSSLDTTQQIRRDGKITLPLVGEVQAAGMTTETLRQNLVKLYAPQLSSKEIIVTVASSSFPVFVTGYVIHPGKIISDHPITALDAIMEAGGFDYTKANLKAVRVIRREQDRVVNYTLNLRLVLKGKETKPFYLKPSDIVFVPERFSWF